MSVIVAKFGGSSLSCAEQFKKVKDIVFSDKHRCYVVPSAPGKRFGDDIKVTDLLYSIHNSHAKGDNIDSLFSQLAQRFIGLRDDLGLSFKIEDELDIIYNNILSGATADYCASRGEYLNGILLSQYLNYSFIDAKDVLFFDSDGNFEHDKTKSVMRGYLNSHQNAVIPGFYGSSPDGNIKTFSRGGSDITGAVVARAARAAVYENWTDVPGFLMADPRIIPEAKVISKITYRELRELSYMGATVLHEDSVFPVFRANIPIHVRNTNDPAGAHTMIVPDISGDDDEDIITGIAGKKNFTVINIEKNKMNSEIGFGRKVLTAVEKNGLNFEHMPSGIDTLSVVIPDAQISDKLQKLIDDIYTSCAPDSIDVTTGLALIATVGRGMIRQVGIAANLFSALAHGGVNIRMIDQGSSELNIIVGVENADFEKAIKAIYHAFVK